MKSMLAIDQSTSATKAVLFETTGRVLDRAARGHRQLHPRPGWVEHDANEIWENTRAVVGEIAGRTDLSGLLGLGISNQRETVVPFDLETSTPLHNAVVWQCRRGDQLCQDLRDKGHDAAIHRKTGLKLDSYFSASKLAWLLENAPQLAARIGDGSAAVGTIDTYLVHRLTEGAVFATDHTNASRTLLFDVRELCWDRELCELFAVPMSCLPEVRESAATFGESDVGGLLPRRVPIVGVMGDSQASLFAQRCYLAGSTKATFGTGTSVLMNIGSTMKLDDRLVTALAWVWGGRPTYAFEGLISYSAATLAWLKVQLGLIRDETEIEPLARSVPDCGGVYVVPAFSGLSAPYWASEARAAILGLTAFSRREHVVRAVLESIAYQLRDVLDVMSSAAGLSQREIFADGRPTRNEFLMQLTADITRATLSVSEISESSAWGAAMSGLLGLGRFASLEELSLQPRQMHEYSPLMAAADVEPLYDGWRAAVQRVL